MALAIAIDGPAGAGKSTVADSVAKSLGILHLDTGAMYRALALKALRTGTDVSDEAASVALAQSAEVTVAFDMGKQRTLLDGEDVTGLIREEDVSRAASAISEYGGVRGRMAALQRAYAKQADVVVDGRDIGTNVLPDATCKFFLTADQRVRARRRWEDMQIKDPEVTYDEVLADMVVRDERDTTRKHDPLRQAEDALLVDSTDMDEQQVIDLILRHVREVCA